MLLELATLMTKPKEKLMTTQPWPLDEKSTRNCSNCLLSRDGVHVRCKRGRPLVKLTSRPSKRLTYNGVIRLTGLARSCQDCPDFDNDWLSDAKDKLKKNLKQTITNSSRREVLASCPGCLTLETIWLKGKRLEPTKKFHQDGKGMIYHRCGTTRPCRLVTV